MAITTHNTEHRKVLKNGIMCRISALVGMETT